MMKLNYFIDLQDHDQVRATYAQFASLKMNADEKIALDSRMFGYALQFRDRALAETCPRSADAFVNREKGAESGTDPRGSGTA